MSIVAIALFIMLACFNASSLSESKFHLNLLTEQISKCRPPVPN